MKRWLELEGLISEGPHDSTPAVSKEEDKTAHRNVQPRPPAACFSTRKKCMANYHPLPSSDPELNNLLVFLQSQPGSDSSLE